MEKENNNLNSLLSHHDIGNTVFPADLFQERLKEELLRTNRTQQPFLYIKIQTRYFDLFGFVKPNTQFLRAWKIAVLTLMAQTKLTDIIGYLQEGHGLGVILLNSDISMLNKLRKQILRNIYAAGLLKELRSTPQAPMFNVSIYTGLPEKQEQKISSYIDRFNADNKGYVTLSKLFYENVLPHKQRKPLTAIFKRLFDFTGALLGIIILSPLLIACAVAVKLSDPKGPVIFKQTRVGKNGNHFTMFKFRSMYVDAEARKAELEKFNESGGPTFKMKNDPRIYPVGRILRKFSLDELPQLFNILLGDMSVVGPRPPIPQEVAEYLPWHKMRLSVTPGLTCFWQVSGRSNVSFEEWMRLDNQYIRHGNLSTDLQLVAKTFQVVFKGDGAY